jgi:hypothetical protein
MSTKAHYFEWTINFCQEVTHNNNSVVQNLLSSSLTLRLVVVKNILFYFFDTIEISENVTEYKENRYFINIFIL